MDKPFVLFEKTGVLIGTAPCSDSDLLSRIHDVLGWRMVETTTTEGIWHYRVIANPSAKSLLLKLKRAEIQVGAILDHLDDTSDLTATDLSTPDLWARRVNKGMMSTSNLPSSRFVYVSNYGVIKP